MPYEVVARRWRPLTFDSVVGQRHVTATLANAIERSKVAHAFLFTGIRGVGKTTVARLLARALNCRERRGAEPCNECSSCKQILAGSSVDVLEIDGASNRGIEEVRALIDAAGYRPASSPYRVYIIDEFHQLTREAFNALLKILEEPPEHVKFVLATTEAHKVPPTVLSRCQRYDFRRLGMAEITEQLERIIEQDQLAVSPEALALIAREADGSMRDAQSLLEQVAAATGGEAEAADVARLLGVAAAELISGCAEAILTGQSRRLVDICTEIRNTGTDLEKFLFEVLELLRHVTVASAAGEEALSDTIGQAAREAAIRLKEERSQLDLQRIFNSLLMTADELRRSGMPELVLEMGLLKAAALERVLSAGEILARLEGLGGAAQRPPGPRGASQAPRRDERGGRQAAPAPQRGGAATATAARARASESAAGATAARAAGKTSATGATGAANAPDPSNSPGAPGASSATTGATAPSASPDETGAPRSSGSRSPSAGQTPSNPPDPDMPPEAPPPDDASEEPGGRWGAFLERVRAEAGIDLYVTLSNCEVMAFDDERVSLRPMVEGFRRKLEEPKALARVRQLAHEHLDEKLEIRIVDASDNPSGTGVSAHSIEEDRQARMEADALSDPVVQAALEVMDGKVAKISRPDD